MDTAPDSPTCECDWPKRAVEDAWFPVTYDEKVGEYQLILDCGERGKGTAVMQHCPWCGGALGKSKRRSFFTVPSDAERAAVAGTMKSVKSVAQMIEVLGEPSDRIEGTGRTQYMYEHLFKSLDLVVFEHKEHISHTIHGKERSAS